MGKLLKKKCYGGNMSKGGNPYSKMEESKRPNMASGGTVESGDPTMNYDEGGEVEFHSPAGGSANRAKGAARVRAESNQQGVHKSTNVYMPGTSTAGYASRDKSNEWAKEEHHKILGQSRAITGPTSGKSGFAEGGFIGSYQSPCHEHCNHPGMTHEQASGFVEETHPNRMPNHQGLTDSNYQTEAHEEDMVGEALVRRKQLLSQGGKVANSDLPVADFSPNEFDDLHLRDDLSFNYTGANSGDEDGDAEEEKRRNEAVHMAMMKRRAKK